MIKSSQYFRISVTSKCNLSCFFCHKEGNRTPNTFESLTSKEFGIASRVALLNGFNKLKITGGEPTVRNDIADIVYELSSLHPTDLSMITNGTNLEYCAEDLWKAGLRRLNMTINTINPNRFSVINGNKVESNFLEKIIRGLESAKKAGFTNIKANFVYFNDESKNDLSDMLQLSTEYGIVIVLLPVIGEDVQTYTLQNMYNMVSEWGIRSKEVITDAEGIQKLMLYMESGARILLRVDELNEKMPYKFCKECAVRKKCREGIFPIRLSSDGILIPCLASDDHRVNVLDFLRSNDYCSLDKAFKQIRKWHNE